MFSNRVELSKGGKLRYYGTSIKPEMYIRGGESVTREPWKNTQIHRRILNRWEVIGLSRLPRICVCWDALLYTMCISCAPGPISGVGGCYWKATYSLMDRGRQTLCDSALIKLSVTINHSCCSLSNQSILLWPVDPLSISHKPVDMFMKAQVHTEAQLHTTTHTHSEIEIGYSFREW